MRLLLALTSICLVISACSTTPRSEGVEPGSSTGAAGHVSPPGAGETEAQRQERVLKMLAEKSIYFAYDDFSIQPHYQDLLQQSYAVLKSAPPVSIMLEGNADERGSTEYNLALGQKRAESVKNALKLLGMPDGNMEAISYGKERPRATCSEEKCWAENRRVDFAARKSNGR